VNAPARAQPRTIPALSLLQPWASLVALGNKCVETRSWATRYRGLLAIHASKRWHHEDALLAQTEPFRAAWRAAQIRTLRELPLGAVVAVCILTECRHTEEVFPLVSDQERAFGNYQPGRWAWVLTDIHRLPKPMLARGALGVWTWQVPEGVVL
jgi:activating signal cointegrator 1